MDKGDEAEDDDSVDDHATLRHCVEKSKECAWRSRSSSLAVSSLALARASLQLASSFRSSAVFTSAGSDADAVGGTAGKASHGGNNDEGDGAGSSDGGRAPLEGVDKAIMRTS